MSWQSGQSSGGGVRRQITALPAMSAAALGATQKPMMGMALKQGYAALTEALAKVPGDIDWAAFNAGVQRYQGLGERLVRAEYPVVASRGRVVLRDAGGEGLVVVVVPSMVNRGYVLDLCEGFSLVEHLRQAGQRVLLVDWGEPGAGDGPLGLEEIVAQRLVPLVQEAAAVNGGPVGMFGYCMGGLLALASASLLGDAVVAKLALGAMPWDFTQTASAQHMATGRPVLQPWVAAQGVIPAEAIQQYFWMLDPWSGIRRLMAYGREFDAARVAHLTALEDWLNDGLGLDGPIAGEMLFDWYADNRPLKGEWRVSGEAIDPGKLTMPLWVAITQKDVLVPMASSFPFIGQTRGAQVVMTQTGHVGLVCGRRAKAEFYEPLARWLQS